MEQSRLIRLSCIRKRRSSLLNVSVAHESVLRAADGHTAGRQLQVFNLTTKTKLGSHLVNEDVSLWKWISDTTIGLVTDRDVQHWKVVEGQAAPTKVSQPPWGVRLPHLV